MEVDYNQLPKKTIVHHVQPIVKNALEMGYDIIKIDYKTGMIRFRKDGVKINLYSTSLTISTEMNHPTKGKTQLHRKDLSIWEIMDVFDNPRIHTGVGYYKKPNGKRKS